uniref:Uncharacterized protein n=1 Tax=Cacopsylla melanoneura TaxID=428564 RepID=A0A8D8VBS5_9HEMI
MAPLGACSSLSTTRLAAYNSPSTVRYKDRARVNRCTARMGSRMRIHMRRITVIIRRTIITGIDRLLTLTSPKVIRPSSRTPSYTSYQCYSSCSIKILACDWFI